MSFAFKHVHHGRIGHVDNGSVALYFYGIAVGASSQRHQRDRSFVVTIGGANEPSTTVSIRIDREPLQVCLTFRAALPTGAMPLGSASKLATTIRVLVNGPIAFPITPKPTCRNSPLAGISLGVLSLALLRTLGGCKGFESNPSHNGGGATSICIVCVATGAASCKYPYRDRQR